MWSVAFSSDGKRIASGSDRSIHICDARTGIVSGPPESHTAGVPSIPLLSDGKRIASGSGNQSVRVWDAEPSRIFPPRLIRQHKETLNSIGVFLASNASPSPYPHILLTSI